MTMTLEMNAQGEQEGTSSTDAAELTILFGSQTGNAEYLAHQIHQKAAKSGQHVDLFSLEEWLHAGPPSTKRLLIVTSTHDNGHMPDNAAEFWDWLQGQEPGALDALPYAVLSIGDSMYDDFCKAGHDIDGQLEALGAVRVVEGIDCDIDFEFSAGKWSGPAVEQLLAAEPWSGTTASAGPSDVEAQTGGTGERVRTARIVHAQKLSKPGSAKSVVHYELAFDDDFEYQPGDSLAVFPTNPESLVDEWIAVFGNPEVVVHEEPRSLRSVLREDVELRLTHPGLVVGLSRLKPGSAAVQRIIALIQSGDREELDAWLWGRDVLDVLTDLDCLDLPIEDILDEMRPLQHRDYSIASSPALDEGRVHLTVNGVAYEGARGRYAGTATDFLAARAQDGAPFSVRRLPAHEFQLPASDVPVVMIGPGVGVAPFRAFLRQRQAGAGEADNWLFFGDQHRAFDWLYEEELSDLQDKGALTRLNVAFSRDQAEKHYVQDEILRHGDEINEWINRGAYIFVCGDKNRMAPDVDRALTTVLTRATGSETDAHAALAALKAEGRYVKDVY
ncbi:diflavin oxidoreductase [Leifsonia virtsii]|uniref:Sulfite reductase flavoprotein subunit alpha n=1 Tax=Leifsonia virtsii TaxID=3035915 RepID=A0ABT8IV60_9MICO|nr:sulfite reductase flavoprotein subunit alpha [Leifsonia virtsii]MDN4596697.1 sulfite reductase flavoprotein subunit alpha [Leifsonia virtsii]